MQGVVAIDRWKLPYTVKGRGNLVTLNRLVPITVVACACVCVPRT